MFSFKKTVEKYKEEYLNSLENVLDSGMGMLGPKVRELENQLSNYTGSKHTICCQSGTFALSLALKALDITEGDEVITTPFTWISSTSTIVQSGATPVFVDIDINSFNIDINLIEKAITKKTKAILIVNLFGKLIDNIEFLLKIKNKYNLFIIEDAAQSFGAFNSKYKSCDSNIGDICCTSFYPTKPLCGFGDGGACFTNNDELSSKLKLLRNHGMASYGNIDILGWNARMNEFQAAIILINLKNFKEKTKNRQLLANIYNNKITINCIKPQLGEGHMVAQYSILIENRENFINYLNKNNVPSKIFYHKSILDQSIFQKYKILDLPNTDIVKNKIISIPCYDTLTEKEVNDIINIINNYNNL
jgi:UDP-2-acetamido-2-deoxy-ribo-hexuluronate aminotransferase